MEDGDNGFVRLNVKLSTLLQLETGRKYVELEVSLNVNSLDVLELLVTFFPASPNKHKKTRLAARSTIQWCRGWRSRGDEARLSLEEIVLGSRLGCV
jgi:hypothetical protein